MTTEINWRHNCLTTGPHDGRPEALWQLPLLQASVMFDTSGLQQIVVARIYNDAMQLVQYGVSYFTEEWADQVKQLAEEKFMIIFATKLSEIQKYYTSASWQTDVEGVISLLKHNKLNPHYQPLHSHDTVNLLCRILGMDSVGEVGYQRMRESEAE